MVAKHLNSSDHRLMLRNETMCSCVATDPETNRQRKLDRRKDYYI